MHRESSNVCKSPCEIDYVFPSMQNNNKVHQNSDNSMIKRSYTNNFEWTFCRYCNIYRPPRAHHCQICRHCILKMDHHCPWINNCVGEYNQKYFLQFCSYTFVCSLYSIGCILASFYYAQVNTPVKIIHIALLILASIIFGIFSIAVLCDQVSGVFNDQTNIERLKGQKRPKRGRMNMLRETCGYISMALWLCPIPMQKQFDEDIEMNLRPHSIKFHNQSFAFFNSNLEDWGDWEDLEDWHCCPGTWESLDPIFEIESLDLIAEIESLGQIFEIGTEQKNPMLNLTQN
ncbi:hypothetical protein RDWZM_000519 [Blomia tropicalis]|uniref:Palmitoyltransferase n=1 Tax=Blomia tropicalis TaxID=40697 RepID=A0A9Q0MAP2_BLOTA|nr:hypothetical protein RDWZM_000519 [Blomia tropicalis]